MQTFLPYSDFAQTAKVLDYQRLGKQRVETWQVLQAMDRTKGGWVNHPCTHMWRNHRTALAFYGLVICNEWRNRGYKDNMGQRFIDLLSPYSIDAIMADMPDWLGRDDIHASHRSNLLRKNAAFYRQFWPTEPDDLPYVWPVN